MYACVRAYASFFLSFFHLSTTTTTSHYQIKNGTTTTTTTTTTTAHHLQTYRKADDGGKLWLSTPCKDRDQETEATTPRSRLPPNVYTSQTCQLFVRPSERQLPPQQRQRRAHADTDNSFAFLYIAAHSQRRQDSTGNSQLRVGPESHRKKRTAVQFVVVAARVSVCWSV